MNQFAGGTGPEVFVPHDLTVLHQVALADRLAAGAQSFSVTAATEYGIEPRPHQPEAMDRIATWSIDRREDIGRSMLVPWACGTSKTTTGLWIAGMAGLGERPEGSDRPLKGIYLVSGDTGRTELEDARRRYAPRVRMGFLFPTSEVEHFEEELDLGVFTYQGLSLTDLDKWGQIISNTALLIADESHLGCAPKAKERILAAKPVVTSFFMSGSKDWNENRRTEVELEVEDALPAIDEVAAIRLGLTRGVHLMNMYTGAPARLRFRGGEVAEDDGLRDLAHDKSRNELIVKTIVDLDAAGLPGITRCIPGDGSWHARQIAKLVSEEGISIAPVVDSVGVVARRNNLSRFKDSEDGLRHITVTRMADDTWDIAAEELGYLFLAGPAGTPVPVKGFVGRGSRLPAEKDAEARPTVIMSTVDDASLAGARVGRKARLYTGADAYGLDTSDETIIDASGVRSVILLSPEQGGASGPARGARGLKKKPPVRAELPEEELVNIFSEDVRGALARGAVMHEALILQETFPELGEGVDLISRLPIVEEGLLSYKTARDALRRAGTEPTLGGRQLYMSVDGHACTHVATAEAYLRATYESHTTPVARFRDINYFFEAVAGWPVPSESVVWDASIAAGANPLQGERLTAWQLSEFTDVVAEIASHPFVNPDKYLSLIDLARGIGKDNTEMFNELIAKMPSTLGTHVVRGKYRAGQGFAPYMLVDVISIEGASHLVSHAMRRSRTLTPISYNAEDIVSAVQGQARANIAKNVRHGAYELDPDTLDEFVESLRFRIGGAQAERRRAEIIDPVAELELVKGAVMQAVETLQQGLESGGLSESDRAKITRRLGTIRALGMQIVSKLEGSEAEVVSDSGPDFKPKKGNPAKPKSPEEPAKPTIPEELHANKIGPESKAALANEEALTPWGLQRKGAQLSSTRDRRLNMSVKPSTLVAIRAARESGGEISEVVLWDMLGAIFPDFDASKMSKLMKEIQKLATHLRVGNYLCVKPKTIKGRTRRYLQISTTGEKLS